MIKMPNIFVDAAIGLCALLIGFGYTPNRDRMEAKKAKVRKYLGFSIHLGMVEGETDVCEHPMALPANE